MGGPFVLIRKVKIKKFVAIALLSAGTICFAENNRSVKTVIRREENQKGQKAATVLPYVFSTESMGVTVGVGAITKGYGQDQLRLGTTYFASADGATGLYLGMWDYKIPGTRRLFFSIEGMAGYYPKQRAYSFPFYPTGSDRPGSNESDENDYIEKSGYDNWLNLKLEYVLPIGGGKRTAIQQYELKDGLLKYEPQDEVGWNPLESGITTLMLKQYNRYRNFELDIGDLDATVHPVQFGVFHDNTDFPNNPSKGSAQFFGITKDFGWFESSREWSFVEVEANKFFSLGPSEHARQRVVALNFWTGDTPSWNVVDNGAGIETVENRPPFYEGAKLGGFYRMRAYPVDRFNDRSVIYATAEYRYTMHWNPFRDVSWLEFLETDWFQLVGFVEGGRVAPSYTASDLLTDWKYDVGFSLRGLFAGGVARLDFAFNDESAGLWVMVNHPF